MDFMNGQGRSETNNRFSSPCQLRSRSLLQVYGRLGMIKTTRDAPYLSCTIITRNASECLKDIHDRMPAILPPDTYDAWLDQRNQDGKGLQEILAERTVTEFKFRPVSRQVRIFLLVLKFLFQPGNPIISLYESVIIDHSRGDRIDNGHHYKIFCP